MNLDIKEWKEFMLGRLFSIKYGVNLELVLCQDLVQNKMRGSAS